VTRRIPPIEMVQQRVLATPTSVDPAAVARDIFKGAPAWQAQAALAALYRFRADLGVEPDDDAHAAHMLAWPRHADYFNRVCRLLRWFGVGSQWGAD